MKIFRSVLLKYYYGLCREFHGAFIDVLEDHGRETVHDLRVTMKKLRAFFRFLQTVDSHFSTREARAAYGELYDLAGRVRDAQVERLLLRRRVHLAPFIHRMLRRREADYLRLLQAYELELTLVPVRELERRVETHVFQLQTPSLFLGLAIYFTNTLEQIRHFFDSGLHPESLHDLRKRLKDLSFNIQMLEMLHPEDSCSRRLIKKLNRYQVLLGNWHDLDFIHQMIQDGSEKLPAKARSRIRKDWEKATAHAQEQLSKLPRLLDPLQEELMRMMDLAQQAQQAREHASLEAKESLASIHLHSVW